MNTGVKIILATACILAACSDKNGKSDAYGNFESTEVLVSSEMAGKILKLNVEEGQSIKAGELVAVIDTLQLVLKREQLEVQKKLTSTKLPNIQSQIDVQEEQKRTLLTDRDRVVKLIKDNAAPTKQLDDIDGKIKVIESQIASIKTQNASVFNESAALDKQISQIDDQIKRCKILNPITGTVLEKYAEPSEIAGMGRNLYKIADLEKMILRVYVSGAQLSSVKIGQKVKVLIDKNKDEKQAFEGTVSWISSQTEFTPKIIQTKEERVNMVYAVKISVKNDGSIKIGMPGEMKL